ncbi:unnamed protein product [Rotaria magnacalcarata]|uniref:Uncharacterized protein n=1 Tax=Rotaria magnacalcarata TaxID=392030 RepID=A0A819EXV3_9BILA|nr:unnamed protein product [Rotaria magnacalcarata]CAF2074113.1 unnamed protein product [Rotaria magnacalcarata]CAF3826999.1 unnamed protein product [Rotaria magnacalcarata]CAF3856735.1 unnamed protein product [Rotaria magnacalcarata]
MLRDTEEGQRKKLRKTRKHRSLSQEGKLNRSPSSNRSDRSRKRYRSSTVKRNSSLKLTKEEIKYQRFVRDLKKEIRIFLSYRLRESRFDPRGKQDVPIRFSIMPTRATSTMLTSRTNEATAVTNHRQGPIKNSKNDHIERLTADVQSLLTGPSFKDFYGQFIQTKPRQTRSRFSLRSLDESLVLTNDED